MGVFPAVEGGFGGFVRLKGVEVFQEEQPGGLLGVVEFAGAAGVFPEDVVDVFKGLFEQGRGGRRGGGIEVAARSPEIVSRALPLRNSRLRNFPGMRPPRHHSA